MLSSGGWARASTDSDGRALFDIDGPVLRIEEPYVPVDADGIHLVGDGPVNRVELDRNEIEFVMREARSTAGVVLRPDGLPLEAALLEVLHDEQPVGYTVCDRKGRFAVTIPAGELPPCQADSTSKYPPPGCSTSEESAWHGGSISRQWL